MMKTTIKKKYSTRKSSTLSRSPKFCGSPSTPAATKSSSSSSASRRSSCPRNKTAATTTSTTTSSTTSTASTASTKDDEQVGLKKVSPSRETSSPPPTPPREEQQQDGSSTSTTLLLEISQQIISDLQSDDRQTVFQALEQLFETFESKDDDYSQKEEEEQQQDMGPTIGRNDDDDYNDDKLQVDVRHLISMIIGTMKTWSDDKEIQIFGSGCLGFISGQSEQGRWAVIDSTSSGINNDNDNDDDGSDAAMELVVAAMKAFPKSSRIQNNGFGLMINLLGPEPSSSSTAAATGAALVEGNGKKGATRGDCCCSLERLTQKFVDQLNGFELVREAMFAFPQEDVLQLMGCAIYWRLSLTQDYHMPMVEKGVVATVAFALEQHLDDAQLRQYTKVFFQNIFSDKGVFGQGGLEGLN